MDRMAWEVTHSPELRDFVAAWESLRTHAYQDVAGVWTIGYGRTQDVQPGDTCTQDQAAEWLDETLTDFGKRLQRYMTREPSQQQYDALASAAFNCGVAAIGDSAKSEAAAKLEAQKAWKGVVQFEHGNKFLDLQNADNIEYQCGPSSVPKFGGLIENAASKFLPIESITCRLSAQPCATPVQRDNGK